MDIQQLTEDEDTVRRFVEELWIPYHRTLEVTVDGHALTDDGDVVADVVEFQFERLDSGTHRTWVAVDGKAGEATVPLDDSADLAGFVATSVDASPSVFDRPDRLTIDDLYVGKRYRGTGLARDLVRAAVEHARESGCTELALDVHVDNERGVAFYERLGFEPYRRRMLLGVDEFE